MILSTQTLNASPGAHVEELRAALRGTFGANRVSIEGRLSDPRRPVREDSPSSFYLQGANNDIAKLRTILKSQGMLTDNLRYRLDRRITENPMFKWAEPGIAYSFANKTMPLRLGAKRISADMLKRFDSALASNDDYFYYHHPTLPLITSLELVEILGQVTAYSGELLEAVGADITPEAKAHLAELLQLKSLRVIKESFVGMPYLKKHREADKNLAEMVKRGLSYERLLVLNVLNDYAPTEAELNARLSLPHDLMVALSEAE